MTYCAAFIRNGSVHVVADSAVTSSENLEVPRSVFGEEHIDAKGTRIQDGAKKIIVLGDEILTFAGRYAVGIQLAKQYVKFRANRTPGDAFELAIISMCPPPPEGGASALLAAFEHGRPKLWRGVLRLEPIFEAVEDFASFGAAPEVRGKFDEVVRHVASNAAIGLSDADLNVMAVASCLGVALRDGTINSGVGGAFNAARCDQFGVHWLDDSIVATYRCPAGDGWPTFENTVALSNRNNVFIAREKIGEKALITAQIVSDQDTNLALLHRDVREAVNKALTSVKTGKFAYVAFVSKDTGNAHVVSMERHPNHLQLRIIPPQQFVGTVEYTLTISPKLRSHIAGRHPHPHCCFWPYEPVTMRDPARFNIPPGNRFRL